MEWALNINEGQLSTSVHVAGSGLVLEWSVPARRSYWRKYVSRRRQVWPAQRKYGEETLVMSLAPKIEEKEQGWYDMKAQKDRKGNDDEGELSGGKEGVWNERCWWWAPLRLIIFHSTQSKKKSQVLKKKRGLDKLSLVSVQWMASP